MEFSHSPVLLDECMNALAIRPDGIYVDCTLGGGGHSAEIAKRLTTGRLIGIDRDDEAITAASARLAKYAAVFTPVRAAFDELEAILPSIGAGGADGVLFDLGVSSHQLDDADRGFSYQHDAPLDMRMDRRQTLTAANIVNDAGEAELADILFTYGEERFARRIASAIVRERTEHTIATTGELSEIIARAMPAAARREKHPSKRSFQALRIAVNGELDRLHAALDAAQKVLLPHGRLCVITFHSLEDRIVKRFMVDMAQGCTCPPEFPICVCGNTPKMRQVTKKPILPSERELSENPRSHSAKLRIAEKN